MGKKVAFLVLWPETSQIFGVSEGAECTVFPGVFNADSHYKSPFIPFRNVLDMHIGRIELDMAKKVIAEEMQDFIPKFIERYEGISYRDLPALYVFTKYKEEGIVFPLGNEWSIDSLASKLNDIRVVTNVDSEEIFFPYLDEERMKSFTNRMNGLAKKLTKNHNRIKTKLSALAWDYDGSPNDKSILCKVIENRDYKPDNLKETLSQMTFVTAPGIENDSNMISTISLASEFNSLEEQALKLIEEERLLSKNRSTNKSLLDIDVVQ